MKKIAFVDFWGTFRAETFKMTEYLRELDEVEITDMEHADYVFFSNYGNRHWFAPDRCVKIFFTIEDVAPDFSACDYAIGFEWMEYEDRYLRLPLYYLYPDVCERMEKRHQQSLEQVRAMKKDFCSITVTNDHRHPIFKELFEALSKYKRVDSGGLWHNNMGGRVADKLAFDQSHKFSIVCENTAHSGYTTEKIVQALGAHCVPIYWGDTSLSKVFNPHAIINVQQFSSVDDVVAYVKQVDADDTLFEQMVMEPALADEQFSKANQTALLKAFLANIFQQPLESAYRRNRLMWGEMYIEERRRQASNPIFKMQQRYHQWVWKIKETFRKRRVDKGKQQVFPAIPT